MTERPPYRVVQPWGPDKAAQSALISEHPTADAAFAEIDRLASVMERTGAPTNAVELLVVDGRGRLVARPNTH